MKEFSIYSKLIGRINAGSESKKLLYRTLTMMLVFWLTVFFVYIAPIGSEKLFCAVLLVLFWYSKSDYFWFAFFIVISAYPAGLFSQTTADAVRRLPIYSPVPKISFSMLDLFLIIALIKAILKRKKPFLIDIFKLKYIVYIIPYLFIVSFFYGMTLKTFLNSAARGLFFYTLLYSFPVLINNKKEVYKFMTMFFPFVLLELIAQIFTIRNGYEFANLFMPGSISEIYNSVSGEIRAIPTGYLNMRLAFVFAFVILEAKEKISPKFYTYLVILASLSSVVISATRSSIVMFFFIFIGYFVFVTRKKPNIIVQIFATALLFLFFLNVSNIIDINSILGSSYNRFVGAVSVEEGNIHAEDTFDNRISNRLPAILNNIKSSFFLGYGFSDRYFYEYDGHLGGVLVGLLQLGIFGYSLIIAFIINLFKKCFSVIKMLEKSNTLVNTVKIFVISFFGYMIVNVTIDPIFVINTSTLPQDIFIHLVAASFLINLALKEQIEKKHQLKNSLSAIQPA